MPAPPPESQPQTFLGRPPLPGTQRQVRGCEDPSPQGSREQRAEWFPWPCDLDEVVYYWGGQPRGLLHNPLSINLSCLWWLSWGGKGPVDLPLPEDSRVPSIIPEVSCPSPGSPSRSFLAPSPPLGGRVLGHGLPPPLLHIPDSLSWPLGCHCGGPVSPDCVHFVNVSVFRPCGHCPPLSPAQHLLGGWGIPTDSPLPCSHFLHRL